MLQTLKNLQFLPTMSCFFSCDESFVCDESIITPVMYSIKDEKILQLIFETIGKYPDELKYQRLNVKNLSRILDNPALTLNLLLKLAFNYTPGKSYLKFIGVNEDAIEKMLNAATLRHALAQCAVRACSRTDKDNPCILNAEKDQTHQSLLMEYSGCKQQQGILAEDCKNADGKSSDDIDNDECKCATTDTQETNYSTEFGECYSQGDNSPRTESYCMNEDLAVIDAFAKEYEKISRDANNWWKCYNCHKVNSVFSDLFCKHCDCGLNKFYYFIFNERDPTEYRDFICNKIFGLIKGRNKRV